MLHRRLQVLIDEPRYQRLLDRAREQNMSVAAVVRELVDRGLPASDRARAEALQGLLDAEPMSVPDDPRDIRRELDDARDRS